MIQTYVGKRAINTIGAGGFTMVEAIVAVLLVAIVLSVSMRGIAGAVTMRVRVADRTRAQQLAADLLAEALQQSYVAPTTPDPAGPPRSGWTCVDDYNGFSESPPVTRSGNAIPDTTGLTRTAIVEWIDPSTLSTSNITNTGIKRITVQVLRGNLLLASVAGYRTSGWVEVIPTPLDATGNHAPTASFTASPLTGKGHINVSFNASASSDPDSDGLSYVWNFGDGTTGTGATITHNYTTIGTYTATLTVYDGEGGTGVATVTITVTQ